MSAPLKVREDIPETIAKLTIATKKVFSKNFNIDPGNLKHPVI